MQCDAMYGKRNVLTVLCAVCLLCEGRLTTRCEVILMRSDLIDVDSVAVQHF
jgi:hypothetical protein